MFVKFHTHTHTHEEDKLNFIVFIERNVSELALLLCVFVFGNGVKYACIKHCLEQPLDYRAGSDEDIGATSHIDS